jgi:hypothetical protein
MMGWDYVSEPRPSLAYCSSPGWYVSVEDHGMMLPAGNNSWLVHYSSLVVLRAETSGESRRNGRRSENFAYQYLKYLRRSLTCRKILRHGTSGFTSHPKEGVLWIFIALKNPSPRPALNPRPLVLVASTLTTTPPRWHKETHARLPSFFSLLVQRPRFYWEANNDITYVLQPIKIACEVQQLAQYRRLVISAISVGCNLLKERPNAV